MNRIRIYIIVAIASVVSFVAGVQWHERSEGAIPATTARRTEAVPFDYQPPAPTITSDQAKGHRARHYETMSSVDNVLELPTDFAQTEALYTIAGRAGAGELERLIQESLSIADRYDRRAALDILFSRYVELDPHAAVDYLLLIDLDIDDMIIGSVFQQWAKLDPDSAVARANQITNVRQRKYAGNAILRSTARLDPGRLEAVSAQLADRHELSNLRSEAIGIRANYDPQNALQEALGMTSRNARWDAIWRVGHVWARNDPATALDYASGIDDMQMREQFISAVIGRWMGDDPETAMQVLLAIPDSPERANYLRRGLAHYAETDPASALALAGQFDGPEKTRAYQSIFSVWLVQDPDAALQELAVLEGMQSQHNLLAQVGQTLAQTDPAAALRWVNTLDAERRARYLPDILGQMAQADPEGALQAALSNDSQSGRQHALTRVLQYVSRSNPQLAIQYVGELRPGPEHDNVYATLAGGLAMRDSQAAMAWISTLSGSAYNNAVSGMAGAVAVSDPDLAASLVGQVPADKRGDLIRRVGFALSHRDPQTAMTWLGRFRNEPGYEAAAAHVAVNFAQKNPHYALRIADGLGGDQRRHTTQTILNNWAAVDPVAAGTWAAGSDPEQRARAVGAVARTWASMDATSASRWVQSMRPGAAKDQGLIELAAGAGLDTRQTTDLINAIGSTASREQAIVAAYIRLFNQYNETVATELLDRVDAGAAVREQLLNYPGL